MNGEQEYTTGHLGVGKKVCPAYLKTTMGAGAERVTKETQTPLPTNGNFEVERWNLIDPIGKPWNVTVTHPDISMPFLPWPITMAMIRDIEIAPLFCRTGLVARPTRNWNAPAILVFRDGKRSFFLLDHSDELERFSAAIGVNTFTQPVPVQEVDLFSYSSVIPGTDSTQGGVPKICWNYMKYEDGITVGITFRGITYPISALQPVLTFDTPLIS